VGYLRVGQILQQLFALLPGTLVPVLFLRLRQAESFEARMRQVERVFRLLWSLLLLVLLAYALVDGPLIRLFFGASFLPVKRYPLLVAQFSLSLDSEPASSGHDRFAVREAVKLRFLSKVVERLACLGEFGQVLVVEISALLAKLLQQPAPILIRQAPDHLQEVLGELGIGHGLRLSPIQIFLVRRSLIVKLEPFLTPGSEPQNRGGGVSHPPAGGGLGQGRLCPHSGSRAVAAALAATTLDPLPQVCQLGGKGGELDVELVVLPPETMDLLLQPGSAVGHQPATTTNPLLSFQQEVCSSRVSICRQGFSGADV
jgi:hypothetical protein